MERQKINIFGPCAAETSTQILTVTRALKEKGIGIMRASWWKPRSTPGFDGVGIHAAPWFADVTRMGLTVATEVMIPDHVTQVMRGIIEHSGIPEQVLLWVGSRNQNHIVQREIARTMLGETPEKVRLLIKNQPWFDEKHWMGIIDHVANAGFPRDRIILCHRGFAPGKEPNPLRLRNIPDWEMAMRIKERTKLPMVIDPSHIGGTRGNVWQIIQEAAQFPFDGMMLEVHPWPEVAATDAKQQLALDDLDTILRCMSSRKARVLSHDASLDYA